MLRVDPDGNGGYGSAVRYINAPVGTRLEFSFDGTQRTSGSPPRAHVGAASPGLYNQYSGAGLGAAPGVYEFTTLYPVTAIYLASGDNRAGFYNDFDNVSLIDLGASDTTPGGGTPPPPPPPPPGGTNILGDTTFAGGIPAEWQSTEATLSVAESGLRVTASGTGLNALAYRQYPAGTLTIGEDYQLVIVPGTATAPATKVTLGNSATYNAYVNAAAAGTHVFTATATDLNIYLQTDSTAVGQYATFTGMTLTLVTP